MERATPKVKRKSRRSPRMLGYLIDPLKIYKDAVQDGTAVKGQLFATVTNYKKRLTQQCGIPFNDLRAIYSPSGRGPYWCVPTAAVGEKTEMVKEFLKTSEDPRLYKLYFD